MNAATAATKEDVDRIESKIDTLILDMRLLQVAIRDHMKRISRLESVPPPHPSSGESAE